MFVICPLSNCATPEKRDRFLDFISKIAPVTHDSEPKCRAYAWFRSAEDNDVVPGHWLRGLEVYEDVEANTVTHRASEPYKAFRAAVGEERLLERPSDLRFWHPARIGFLTRDGQVNFTGSSGRQYIVIDELRPKSNLGNICLGKLEELAQVAKGAVGVGSFWVLRREFDNGQDEVYVFSRFESKSSWDQFEDGTPRRQWEEIYAHCTWTRRTTWTDSGVGFIGR